eukprot:g3288.t1
MAYANKPSAGSGAEMSDLQRDCASDGHVVCGDYRKESFMEDPLLPLWSAQKNLAPLPVPTLKETCERYLRSIEALALPSEYERSKEAVAKFLSPSGLGHVLQKRLKKRSEEQGENNSWLQEWWNKYSYLGYREPNVIYVSYYYHLKDSDLPRMRQQIPRACALVRSALEFRRKVCSGILTPQTEGKKRTPICSTAFKYMFNACRVPRSGSDVYYMYPHDAPGSNTILVIYKRQFYICQIADRQGKLHSANILEAQLRALVDSANSGSGRGGDDSAALPLGILTTAHRDAWAASREQLLADGGGEFLDAVQRTAFALCLDETCPKTRDATARALWHGDGKNRWFDKSIQICVFPNGTAGMIGEHSMMDGAATLHLCNYMCDNVERFATSRNGGTAFALAAPLPPAPLVPPVSSRTRWNVLNAEKDFENLVSKHDLKVLVFGSYGSRRVKKMKCSPDAWVQLAIQLAYFYTFGTCRRATYEPVSVRRFRQGRTETVRSVTNESVAFVRSMVENDVSRLAPAFTTQQKRRLGLLRSAASAHVSNIRASIAGRGCDRHLLGLRLLMNSDERCSLFADPLYWRSCHWHISTSALTSEHLESWGFGEVVTDGIGVGYMSKKDSLNFCVTSCHNFSAAFATNLERALLKMARVWADAEGPEGASARSRL